MLCLKGNDLGLEPTADLYLLWVYFLYKSRVPTTERIFIMNGLIYSKIFNIFLCITIIGEFLLPFILKHFYKNYNSKTMVMSVLGCPESPVRNVYNTWLVWLGIYRAINTLVIN